MKNVMRRHVQDAFFYSITFITCTCMCALIIASSDAHTFLFHNFTFSTPHMGMQNFVSFRIVFCLVGQQPNLMMLCCERTHSQKLCNSVLKKYA